MNALTRPDEKTTRGISSAAVELRRRMQAEAREQALRAIAGTDGGATKRNIKWIPADRAGEWYGETPDGVIKLCAAHEILTQRQCDAARYLAECYARGGGQTPYLRHGQGVGEQSDEEMAYWRRQYEELLEVAPRATRWALQTLCQDQWVQNIQAWRLGLDAVADRLRLAR